MHHEMKIHPEYFDAKRRGLKPWEARVNDRGLCVGDTVTFREWNPAMGSYTGREYGPVKITYMLEGTGAIKDGHCVFSHTTGEWVSRRLGPTG